MTDPQTSGGLLVAVAAPEADRILELIRGAGFASAAVVGRVRAGTAGVTVNA